MMMIIINSDTNVIEGKLFWLYIYDNIYSVYFIECKLLTY